MLRRLGHKLKANPKVINARQSYAHHTRAMSHERRAGVSGLQQLKYYNQMQALARPANASDPKLRLWIKSAAPVIAQPPANALPSQFRDPTTAWRQVSS